MACKMGRVGLTLSLVYTWTECPCSRYPITQATWEEEEAMSDPQKLIEDFTIAAAKEGLPDDPHITLLLKEAVKGGCVDPNA